MRRVYKWRQRYRNSCLAGLKDRSSRPLPSPSHAPAIIEARVVTLRRNRRIHDRAAFESGLSRAAVVRILVRHGLNRWSDLEPTEPVLREWTYAKAYPNSDHRKAERPFRLYRYNWHRPHAGIKKQTPINRLGFDVHKLLRLHVQCTLFVYVTL